MDDLISRQAAIEALKTDMASLDHIIKGMSGYDVRLDAYVSQKNQVSYDIDTINNLPTAQPEELDTLIKALEKEHRRLIEMQKALPKIVHCKDCKNWIPFDWMFSETWQSQNMDDYPQDEIGCRCCDMAMKANDFCSRAERRTDDGE